VREALWSILDPRPRGPFADLFAGGGLVALEAHSCGFGPVAAVEQNPALVRHIENTMLAFQAPVEVVRGNALKILEEWAARGRSFACVFADPPYRYPLQRELLQRARRVLEPDGLFVLEASRPFPLEVEAGRVYRYGDTVLALFDPV
jgi:16S rRNA G966 N2-methylase RsmD